MDESSLNRLQKAVLWTLESLCEWTGHIGGCWFARKTFNLQDRWENNRG